MRSNHPTHLVFASGRLAKDLTQDHDQTIALGRSSPFHKMALGGGLVLHLGVGFKACSLIHVSEILANVYCKDIFCWNHLGWKPKVQIIDQDGKIRIISQKEIPGCSDSFPKLEKLASQENIIREGKVGEARAQLMKGEDLLELVISVLKKEPGFLLCSKGSCVACSIRQR